MMGWEPAPTPPSAGRSGVRFIAGLALVLKGHEKAAKLRRSARRLKDPTERAARLAAADLLDWAADHPSDAVDAGEAVYDWLRTPPQPQYHW